MSSTNTKNNKDHCIKFKLGISSFLDASAFMCCPTLKIGNILFILGFLSHLLIARCDIGVQLSVRPSTIYVKVLTL